MGNTNSKFSVLRDYILLTISMSVGSAGWVIFLLPNHITLGGLPGISSILYWGFGIPVQTTYFVLNIVLLAVALKILGLKFCIRTIYAVIVFTATTALMQDLMQGRGLLANQPFMATVIGGCALGACIGLGLSANGSTGGSDVVAAIINKYRDISLGNAILLCDITIITCSYFVLHSWEMVIYGYVLLFISSTCVDHVVNLTRRSVQFFIISEKHEEISKAINTSAQRGCTIINGQGSYSGKDVKMLFVLARQNESSKIFQLIEQIDPHAFVSQSAVIGVYGLGFDAFKVKRRKSEPKEIAKKEAVAQ